MSPGPVDTLHVLLKSGLHRAQVQAGVDRLFRYLNRHRLLVVMYHGVTEENFNPPVWTQLPVETFRRQLLFLRDHYRMVSLPEVVAAIGSGGSLPERSALITFDDGLRNNFSLAFPLLEELAVPAAIFLTVDLIGTDRIFWFDELYLLIVAGGRQRVRLSLPGAGAQRRYEKGELSDAYCACVEALKRVGETVRGDFMNKLRRLVPLERLQVPDDFRLLDWDEVRHMERSGLVSFGVHTGTHRILSELDPGGLEAELIAPRKRFAQELGREPQAFCFPNGRPGLDFLGVHQDFLRSCGYLCAFTTENALFDWRAGDRLGIGRVPAGNDALSEPNFFRLNTSGAGSFFTRYRMAITGTVL